MPPLPVLPDSALLDETQPADYDPRPNPADARGAADDVGAPRRRWRLRTSDKIGMSTFSVASISAYLLWSVVQGVDDLRVSVRALADEQRLAAVTQERLANTQREHHERLLAHEAHTTARFSDLDGRVTLLRRTDEEIARELRDHGQRLRAVETDRPAPRGPTPE